LGTPPTSRLIDTNDLRNCPLISIIIPVLNEAETIVTLLKHISENISDESKAEIIVVDGGSNDKTIELVELFSENSTLNLKLILSEKGRAKQMNKGARNAAGNILYFLHSDSLPPHNFDVLIFREIAKKNFAGCFRMKFDSNHPILKISQWFTRFNFRICRGGDQSLFITQKVFRELNGYNEDYVICEDCEFINRLYNKIHFKVIPEYIVTSSRKYEQIGTWKLQYYFMMIHLKNGFGADPTKLQDYYNRKIKATIDKV